MKKTMNKLTALTFLICSTLSTVAMASSPELSFKYDILDGDCAINAAKGKPDAPCAVTVVGSWTVTGDNGGKAVGIILDMFTANGSDDIGKVEAPEMPDPSFVITKLEPDCQNNSDDDNPYCNVKLTCEWTVLGKYGTSATGSFVVDGSIRKLDISNRDTEYCTY